MEEKEKKATVENPSIDTLMGSFGPKASFFTKNLLIILAVALALGIGSGYLLSSKKGSTRSALTTGSVDSSSISKGTVVGSTDTKVFKDIAEGVLKKGGIDGEGQYHLVRPGGDSQNVYLTSSNVDLSKFVDKKIKVWGETQKAEHAGWLMDAGRVEVL